MEADCTPWLPGGRLYPLDYRVPDCTVWITGWPTVLSGLPGDRLCHLDYRVADLAASITELPTVLSGLQVSRLCRLNAGHGGPANVPAGSNLILIALEV